MQAWFYFQSAYILVFINIIEVAVADSTLWHCFITCKLLFFKTYQEYTPVFPHACTYSHVLLSVFYLKGTFGVRKISHKNDKYT